MMKRRRWRQTKGGFRGTFPEDIDLDFDIDDLIHMFEGWARRGGGGR
jgi:hypothetical protein